MFIQIPSGTPNPGDSNQLDFSNPFDLIVFIILPICIAIFYFIWRRNNKKG
ncbi:MAG: adenylosuccinate synthetase [Patiriisocius sp.]|uniref:adenylosuccinate synthetase n=1 Tax=Patiriisocius sp. TaxID=2822396 RepID=UPI003EF90A71